MTAYCTAIAGLCLMLLVCSVAIKIPRIGNIYELQNAIKSGSNRKVGVPPRDVPIPGRIQSVLPHATQFVVCDGRSYHGVICNNPMHLIQLVQDGTLLAGLQVDYERYITHEFHVFTSTVITPVVFSMAPDISADIPHGVPPYNSSRDLAFALNAAIIRAQNKDLIREVHSNVSANNMVFTSTCKTKDFKSFPIPNKGEASGVLRKILDDKVFYFATLPAFWPDVISVIWKEFKKLSGPDGEIYGDDIIFKENLKKEPNISSGLYYSLVNSGESYATVSDTHYLYTGSQGPCKNDSDCSFPSESCQDLQCKITIVRSINDMFRSSCMIAGRSWDLFTKKIEDNTKTGPSYIEMSLSIAIPTIFATALMILLSCLIHLERKRKSPFNKHLVQDK